MTAENVKTIFAVLGVVNTIGFLGFVAITWWAGRGRRRSTVRGWDGNDIPVIGRGGWR